RDSGVRYISLVYEEKRELLGHIFFTPVDLVGDAPGILLMGLAPMAVVPDRQRQGIGSALVKAGIQECISEGYDAVFVLGHPEYYPRFGFVPSVAYGIRSEFKVPDEVFMVLELRENALKGKQGTIKYHKAFQNV
ncbi:MAG TPA: N-acetyltransferase, partial [Nitrospiria bacterium]